MTAGLADRWNDNYKVLDPLAVVVLSVATVLATWPLNSDLVPGVLATDRVIFYLGSATVTGPVMGLSFAALAIIADHVSDPAFKDKLDPDLREQLVDVFVSAGRRLGVTTVLAFTGTLIQGTTAEHIVFELFAIGLIASAIAIGRALSVLREVVLGRIA